MERYISWNNISKYASDTIIIDRDNSIFEAQWFDPQLHHMCSHLNIRHRNELGTTLNRKEIIRKILLINKEFIWDTDCKECNLLGMYNDITKLNDMYAYNNIGGKLDQSLTLDTSNNIKYNVERLLYTKSTEIVNLDIKFTDVFLNKRTQPKKKTKSMLENIINSITDKTRLTIVQDLLNSEKTLWNDIGRLEYSKSSSSLDSLFIVIFASNLSGFFLDLLKKKIVKNPLHTNFIEELKNVGKKLNKVDIFTLDDYRIKLKTLFSDNTILTKPFYKNENFHPIFFIQNIFKVLGIPYSPYSELITKYINDDDPQIYDGTFNNIPDIINVLNMEEDKPNNNIVVFDITAEMFNILNTRNIYERNYKKILDDSPEKLIYCEICNEFLLRDTDVLKKHSKTFHKKNNIFLNELLDIQVDSSKLIIPGNHSYSNENIDTNVFWLVRSGWSYEKVVDDWLFFPVGKPTKKISSSIAIELEYATKYNRRVQKYSIKNTQYIFFTFDRTRGKKNKNTLVWDDTYNSIRIIPNEFLERSPDEKYSLECVITNRNNLYISFFKMGEQWISYDSHFNIETQSDYFKEIGTYLILLDHDFSYITKYGTLFIYKRV
jgi:hypothetical protein